jgi:hypothetical protein
MIRFSLRRPRRDDEPVEKTMSTNNESSLSPVRLASYAIAALALTLVTGLVYGRWTQRWEPPQSLKAAAARVLELPRELGAWQMTEERKVPALVLETLRCEAHSHREYVNRETGETVQVALIVGPSGPTAVHEPEICFSSQAYEIARPRETRFFGDAGNGDSSSLWEVRFQPKNVGTGELQVYYGWSTGGAWKASTAPRFEFGGSPLLYKIQVSAQMGPKQEDGQPSDPCKKFIDALLETYWQQRSGRSGA